MHSLPIDQQIPQILMALQQQLNLVLIAAPGAGKTTRLPPALSKIFKGKILVLEPRRIAAVSAADRIAEENYWQLGREVGYHVRFDKKFSDDSQLIFLTEAMLSKWIQQNSHLAGVDCVILDEFHERSIHTDLAIGLLKEIQALERPELKIIVMSATMNPQPIADFLQNASILEVPGQTYELHSVYRKEAQLLQTQEQFFDRCLDQLKEAINQPIAQRSKNSDILFFLPGVREISRLQTILESKAQFSEFAILPLHGQLDLKAQRNVLARNSKRKIILATNVAESSLTIDGVGIVIDSGLARVQRFNLKTGVSGLEMTRVSKSSAIQRAGRAARQGVGWCYKMWSKTDELSMPDFEPAEIHRSDLSDSLLLLASLGITDFQKFSWFELPDPVKLKFATESLRQLGALDTNGHITSLGREILKLPLPPNLAKLVIVGKQMGISQFASLLAALLSERDPFADQEFHDGCESDILPRIDEILTNPQSRKLSGIMRISDQILQNLGVNSEKNIQDQLPKIDELLLRSFSYRLCRRRDPQSDNAQIVGGKGIKLSQKSNVKESLFFIALSANENNSDIYVRLAHGIDDKKVIHFLERDLKTVEKIEFDQKLKKLIKITLQEYQGLKIKISGEIPLSESDLQQHLPEVAMMQWSALLKENGAFHSWLLRLQYYGWFRDINLLNDQQRMNALTEACYGEKNLASLYKKDLVYFFSAQIEPEIIADFNESCPELIEVPSKSKIRIHYEVGKNPFIEVRIQEIFGWSETPKIFQGKVPLTLHLLGPNFRPVQVTEDLNSFWQKGYQDIRKELRIRYPKHSWPEIPWTAQAEAKGKKRQ